MQWAFGYLCLNNATLSVRLFVAHYSKISSDVRYAICSSENLYLELARYLESVFYPVIESFFVGNLGRVGFLNDSHIFQT